MMYISVDNDHHTSLALLVIAKNLWSKGDLLFIAHRSPRNRIVETCGYSLEKVDIHPLCSGLSFKNPSSYWKSWLHQTRLRRSFEFKPDDVLLVTTEYEINNALLARQMRRAGGQIYLFDEGIGFYFNNSPFHDARVTALDKFYLQVYNLAFGLLNIPAYAKKGFEGRMYVRIKDAFIDRIYSRMRLPINRPGPIHGYRNFLASEEAVQQKNGNTAIFFANNLDCFGLKDDDLEISASTVERMATSFEKIYLKIHPADWLEKNEIYDFYMHLVEAHDNIHLIDNALTGNEAIEQFRPRIVVGTIGATMFDAFFFGCQPIFLFQFLPTIREFDICRFTLDNIGYRYIKSIDEVGPNYNCEVDISALIYEEDGSPLRHLDVSAVPAVTATSQARPE